MSGIALAPTTDPAVALLVRRLFEVLESVQMSTAGRPWPLGSLDFSACGDVRVTLSGAPGSFGGAAQVTVQFARNETPVLTGAISLTRLEAILVSAPNYVSASNQSALGPAGSVSLSTPAIAKQKSGVVEVTATASGTQSAQDAVAWSVWRDYGQPGAALVAVGTSTAPGGIAGYPWGVAVPAVTDVLPDALPHTYSLVLTGQGGSQVSVNAGFAYVQAFELGGPG